jgi:hypothetical protein
VVTAITAALLLAPALFWVGNDWRMGVAVPLWVTLAAVAVPLLSVAATRHPLPIALLAPGLALMVTFAGGEQQLGVQASVALSLVVLVVSRAVAASARARHALGVERPGGHSALQWFLAVPFAAAALLLRVSSDFPAAALLPAAGALVLCAASPVSLRLTLPMMLLLLVPETMLVGSLAALALAFAMHHAPKRAAKLLGRAVDASAVPVAVCGALGLAAFGQWAPGSAALANAALVVALAGAGLLLGQRWLLSVAVVALAVPVRAFLNLGHATFEFERALFVSAAFAGAAALLSWEAVNARVKAALAAAGRGFDGDARPALWWGALAAAALASLLSFNHLTPELGAALMVVAALLLVTRVEHEAAVAAVGLGLGALLLAPVGWGGVGLSAVGLSLCAAGAWFDGKLAAARAWHWAGLALALSALALSVDLHHPSIAITWSAACAAAWLAVRGKAEARWVGWAATLATAHVVLFWGGLAFSHGAPRVLILPWVGAASMGLAALALAKKGDAQRTAFGYAAAAFGLLELLAGLVLISGTQPREAVVATVGLSALLWAMGRRAADDSETASVLGQAAAASLWAAWHVLGFGGVHGVLDAGALLVLGAGAHGLSVAAGRAGKGGTARVLALGAYGWPVVAAALVLDGPSWKLGVVLLAAAAHYAWLAQAGRWTRSAAVLSAGAFNLSLLSLWAGAGWSNTYYLLIVAGLSLVVLVRVFETELGPEWAARLRGAAAATIYAAAAWKPLAFDTTWALWVCVLVCVLGVAAGIALKVRSYVYLGTVFLVTSVLSNLVRFGVREPRVGALLLSSLGLLVVGFMVVVTTRRSELLQRYRQVQTMLRAWEA